MHGSRLFVAATVHRRTAGTAEADQVAAPRQAADGTEGGRITNNQPERKNAMNWKHQLSIRLLLLVAKWLAKDEWKQEIEAMICTFSCESLLGKEDKQ
jgi:hypothetical protein